MVMKIFWLSSQWGVGVILGEEMATHSSFLAWKIPWTEEHGGLQSMGSKRAGQKARGQNIIWKQKEMKYVYMLQTWINKV